MCEVQSEDGQYLRFDMGKCSTIVAFGTVFRKVTVAVVNYNYRSASPKQTDSFSSDNVVNLKHVVLANLGL